MNITHEQIITIGQVLVTLWFILDVMRKNHGMYVYFGDTLFLLGGIFILSGITASWLWPAILIYLVIGVATFWGRSTDVKQTEKHNVV